MDFAEARRPKSHPDQSAATIESNIAAFPFPTFTVDIDGLVTAWNPAAGELFELQDHAAVGRRLADLALVVPMKPLLEHVHDVSRTRAPSTLADVPVGQGHKTVRITVSPLVDDRSRVVGCVVTAEDLSVAEAFRRAEEQLRDAQRIERAKDDFLTMLAHELRNPLAPILSAAYVIRRLALSDPTLVAVRRVIERQATHLARLVDDLLEVARIRQGRMELRRARVKLADVTAEAMESV